MTELINHSDTDNLPTFGSVFTGIGGFDLGIERAGWKAVWQIENDRYCNRIMKGMFPDVPKHGDIRTVDTDRLGRVELICGGFPCQDVSVAGKRKGLAGDQSGLFFDFMRVVADVLPRWVLIENVPGLLSSNVGRDMGTVLGTLGKFGYWWAYRCLDSQYFGVPQRRRRIYIVGHLGAPCSPEILFEPQSVYGHLETGGTTGKEVAKSLRRRFDSGSEESRDTLIQAKEMPKVSHPLIASGNNSFDDSLETYVIQDDPAFAFSAGNSAESYGLGLDEGITPPLRSVNNGSTQGPTIAFNCQQTPISDDVPHSLATRYDQAVMIPDLRRHDERHRGLIREKPSLNTDNNDLLFHQSVVRRLTPRECERLQGFPDDWTKGGKDAPRYRTLGNAVTVPVATWIAGRILNLL